MCSCGMDKHILLVLLVLLSFSMMNTNGIGDDNEAEQGKKESFWQWHKLRSAYSIYSSAFSPFSVGQYWGVLKALVAQAYARVFPPNIERGEEPEAMANNGAGEKVKEALAKSLGTSKATLEDTAKSAADIAGDTMQKAKEKLKRSSSEVGEGKRPNEL
ncbi:uncharacterized protein LOC130745659 isoform X2 [Lotus japonicus]|uniref:uncharacterized protein LOC130745659 isoform X2 n=1 Tax=Lotus japonicus TaxID=34305 RepID=UPI002582E22D|nr:uncharacterized protein LOC130745659 isoform X2 [Lotus japonicus]